MTAVAILCCLGMSAAVALSAGGARHREYPIETALRATEEQAASRSNDRAALSTPVPSAGRATPAPTTAAPKPTATATAAAKPKATPTATRVAPVGGLTQAQMNNAQTIVQIGQRLGMPVEAYVVAIATAIQESSLYNQASAAVPESLNYPHEGDSVDYDSVGLFQQRPSMGWGTVRQCMTPTYAATKFYQALAEIDGWQDMAVTEAAQAVQGSAFPDAYAQHEDVARVIVDALA